MIQLLSPSLRFLTPCALLVLSVFAAAAADGQLIGRVNVQITDPGGQPIEGAEISLTLSGTDNTKVQQTNRRGRSLFSVSDATQIYLVSVGAPDHGSVTTTVKPKVGETVVLKLELKPAPSASAPLVSPAADTLPDQQPSQPSNTPAEETHNLGVAALRSGEPDAAITHFQKAIQLDPTLKASYSALAGLHLQRRDYQEAIAAAEELLKLEENSLRAASILYDAGQGLDDKKIIKRGQRILETHGSLENDPAFQYNLGAEALSVGDLEGAGRFFELALDLDQNLRPAITGLALVRLQQSDGTRALELAKKALALEPGNARAIRVWSQAAELAGDNEEAALALRAMAKLDPQGVGSELFAKAQKLFEANDMSGATQELNGLLEIIPDHADAHYLLGLCRANGGDTGGARRALERYLELAPSGGNADVARQMLEHLN